MAGYPRLFGTNPLYYNFSVRGAQLACAVGVAGALNAGDVIYISYSDATWIDSVVDQGDQIISDQIGRANAALKRGGYTQTVVMAKRVDSEFHGHRLCDAGSSHINGIKFRSFNTNPEQTSFHPNESGQADYARAVETALPRKRIG